MHVFDGDGDGSGDGAEAVGSAVEPEAGGGVEPEEPGTAADRVALPGVGDASPLPSADLDADGEAEASGDAEDVSPEASAP